MAQSDLMAPGSAAKSWLAWSRLIVPVVLGVIGDLWLKAYAFPNGVITDKADPQFQFQGISPIETKPVIPHVLGFQTIINKGAVFGWAQGAIPIFVSFSILAIITIVVVFLRSARGQMWLQLALGLILSGAIGNLYDRVRFGGVRDMLRFYVHWYDYIFNVADVLLCIGVPLLILCWMRPPAQVSTEAGGPGKPADAV